MNDIRIFESPEFGQVRTTLIDGEPWFVAADVCKALEIVNPRDAVARLDDDEKNTVVLTDGIQRGNPNMNVVSEAGLYALVLTSRKPEAKAFKRWITHEVLPSIRKDGGYLAGQESLSDDDLLAQALLVAQRKLAQREQRLATLQAENEAQARLIESIQPKASYYEKVLQNSGTVTTTTIAADYGMSPNAFNKLLKERGIHYKRGKKWVPYTVYINEGYVDPYTYAIDKGEGKKFNVTNLRWTQKGWRFLYDTLKADGILPVDER